MYSFVLWLEVNSFDGGYSPGNILFEMALMSIIV